jgi:hypothetical protein
LPIWHRAITGISNKAVDVVPPNLPSKVLKEKKTTTHLFSTPFCLGEVTQHKTTSTSPCTFGVEGMQFVLVECESLGNPHCTLHKQTDKQTNKKKTVYLI